MKRTWLTLGALILCPLLATAAWADDKDLENRISELEQEIKQLKQQQQAQPTAKPPGAAAPPRPGVKKEGKRLEELAIPRDEKQKYGSTMQGSGGLIYARPFVATPKAIVGGYTDLEYFNLARDGNPAEFDAHRLVPFIYGSVTDRIKFATEIEFEHFQRGKLEGGESGPEIGVEFMNIDYLITDPLNLRAGIILLPLGKFNLLHDAPLRDLTDRPIVDKLIIPTTLSRPGAGIYGTFYPTKLSKLDYEVYVNTGFVTEFDSGVSAINGADGLDDAVTSGIDENNDGKAVAGRIAFSPVLGIEVGGSGFWGSYDPLSDRKLSIWAVDWTLQRGPFELIGEAAWAYAEDNHLTLDGAPAFDSMDLGIRKARRMNGYYVQLNYHFLPAFLTRLAPSHFRPEVSTFTAIVRWEETDLNNEVDGNLIDPSSGDIAASEFQRWTFGLNYRPVEDTVLKLDYQLTPVGFKKEGGKTVPGLDHGFVASIATYF